MELNMATTILGKAVVFYQKIIFQAILLSPTVACQVFCFFLHR